MKHKRLSSIVKYKIKDCLNRFGYDIVSGKYRGTRIERNFENLADAYEVLFSKVFGNISKNDLRKELLSRLLGTPPSRAYFIIKALEETKNIKGDVCEFGVGQGETSALMANEISNSNKILHLFDSFEGLPKPSAKDKLIDDVENLGSIDRYEGAMAAPESMVIKRLKSIKYPSARYKIHKGFIENLIKSKKGFPQKVSFAYVDMDFYEPIKIALEFLDKVTSKGGIIIVDEYGFFSTGSKTAIDEFLNEKNKHEKRYNYFVPDKKLGHFIIITKEK